MIFDVLENWETYFKGEAWRKSFEFLLSATPATTDGEHKLLGDAVLARVMSYETKPLSASCSEAHRQFIDIQIVLSGEEVVLWHPMGSLPIKAPYDSAKDAELYHLPSTREGNAAELILRPGLFAVFFPHDLHAPAIGESRSVKKVVVKISISAATLCGS